MSSALRFGVLGPLQIERDGETIDGGGAKFRSVVALLCLDEGEAVGAETLIDAIWGEAPPPTARTALRGHISRLRKLAADDPALAIKTEGTGYMFETGPDGLDLRRFERLVDLGRSALGRREYDEAARFLGEALSLWRAEPLSDLDLANPPIGRLSAIRELKTEALEALIEAQLALDDNAPAVRLLEPALREDPLNERLHALGALAFYRAGRQADALGVLERLRKGLSSELGVEPGPTIEQLEQRILNHDPSLQPGRAGDERSQPREARKFATAIVVRITMGGPAEVDPELEASTIALAVTQATEIAERNGGSVHEALGGRLALLFGVPELHEDDAARAVATAGEIRGGLGTWTHGSPHGGRSEVRTGIGSGDVLVQRTGRSEILLSADPIRVADRLSTLARPGEILLSPKTVRSAEGGATTWDAAPIVIDVGPSPVEAFRLGGIREVTGRRLDRPLVGRAGDLGLLRQTFARVRRERAPSLVTLLGPAGVGKTRLTNEFLAEVGGEATILAGRCLSYGREITYWPLAEMIRWPMGAGTGGPEAAKKRLLSLLGEDPDATFIVEQLVGILGFGPVSPDRDDVFWAVRRSFEVVARDRPAILVFEDLHWAEPTLLDLIEYLAGAADGCLLILCLARQELLDLRPHWGGGRIDGANVVLGPLSEDESVELLSNVLEGAEVAPALMERLLEVGEGHPLFLEELLRMLIEEGMVRWTGERWDTTVGLATLPVPPTVSALLGSRIDRLSAPAREVAEAAAVVGKDFGTDELRAILGSEADPEAIPELQDRHLVVEGGSGRRGEQRFAFRHLLIRDEVYRTMPKAARGRAHEAFGTYLERQAGQRIAEIEEIIGYHLEQAYLYRSELGDPDAGLAVRAAHRLTAAGQRAFLRDEMRPAASLLRRALDLCGADDQLVPEICWRLGTALFDTGDLQEARRILERGLAEADRGGQEALRWRLSLETADLDQWTDPASVGPISVETLADEAVAALTRLEDPIGQARAYRLKGDALSTRGRYSEAVDAYARGRSIALEAGDPWEANRTPLGVVHGPLPVDRCIEVIEDQVSFSRRRNPEALASLGLAHALAGHADEARDCLDRAVALARDLGAELKLASIGMYQGAALLAMDDASAAEQALRPPVEALQRMGEQSMMSTAVAMLGEALYRQGRLDEAMLATVASEAATVPDDLASQMAWRALRAKILAARGDHREAVALARSAASFADQTDLLTMAGDTYADLGTVLLGADRGSEAEGAFRTALDLYIRKGNVVSAARAERVLKDKVPSAP